MGKRLDLTTLSVRELLQLEAGIISEFRERNLVRTNNKPLGDIAEQIVFTARGGILEANSMKSHDITEPSGRRIQVKAMGPRAARQSGPFSPFRSFDFDSAIFLVFEAPTFELAFARELETQEVELLTRYRAHTNSRIATRNQIKNAGVDVTAEMRAAYVALDGAPFTKS